MQETDGLCAAFEGEGQDELVPEQICLGPGFAVPRQAVMGSIGTAATCDVGQPESMLG